jgi:2-(1,2-epoxy-1,2-dihydrophenyl)acetyl-CoA isomerase
MNFRDIRLTVTDGIATLTLNRPERLNAISPSSAVEISRALDETASARALIITGEGRAFCSGASLKGDDTEPSFDAYEGLVQRYNPMMLKLAQLPIPVISAVRGAAAGIGCSLALCADFTLAARSAYFMQAFVSIGLVPDGGASWMLPRLVGKARATRMMMLGQRISAELAEDWGMVHRCVDDDELQTEALVLATRLANGPTLALGLMRRQLAEAMATDFATALKQEAENQRLAAASRDAAEGTLAFLQKRNPVFSGK